MHNVVLRQLKLQYSFYETYLHIQSEVDHFQHCFIDKESFSHSNWKCSQNVGIGIEVFKKIYITCHSIFNQTKILVVKQEAYRPFNGHPSIGDSMLTSCLKGSWLHYIAGVMKFTILVDCLQFIITIYLICLIYAHQYKRRISKKLSISTIWLIWLCPSTRITESYEIYNFGRPFRSHHYQPVCLIYSQ